MAKNDVKARFWEGILYPENMVEDWENKIDRILEFPYAYCIHNKDNLKKTKNGEIKERKTHVHIILAYNNTTTETFVKRVFNKLSAPNKKACSTVEEIHNIRKAYDYLIHDTEKARKDGKYLYDEKERISGNNFDIGALEQFSESEKEEIINNICDFIIVNEIENLYQLYVLLPELSNDEKKYKRIFNMRYSLFANLCKGVYQNRHENKYFEEISEEQAEKKIEEKQETLKNCVFCGGLNIKKNGTKNGLQRYQCKACKKIFTSETKVKEGKENETE